MNFKIIDVSGGFKATLWQVTRAGETHIVHATDNYTAAEACGWSFATADVQEMKLVPAQVNQ